MPQINKTYKIKPIKKTELIEILGSSLEKVDGKSIEKQDDSSSIKLKALVPSVLGAMYLTVVI